MHYLLHIRNMVCDRCKAAVRKLFGELHIRYDAVHLGEVMLASPLSDAARAVLEKALSEQGFELIDDKRSRTVERIKQALRASVLTHAADRPKRTLSIWLAREMNAEYSGLSKLFSEVEGSTIERYHNLLRIERAKELLVYDEWSLTQIADMLGYSSVQHLSNQFAQYVGHSPTHFKRIGAERRNALDKVNATH